MSIPAVTIMRRSCTTSSPRTSAGSLAAPLLFALVAASVLCGCSLAAPLYVINADTPYEAGLQHGILARKQIHGWLQTEEVRSLLEFVAAGDGLAALKRLRVDNAGAFPQLAEELTGVAAGANVTLEDVWALNLLYELEALKDGAGVQQRQHEQEKNAGAVPERSGHCTDVYAGGENFAEGHNEDWSVAVKPFWYWLSLNITGNTPCAGLAYPGTFIGYAPTWNAHGMFSTQNSLYPHATSPSGLGCAFAQRAVLCEARSLQEAVEGLTGGLPGAMSSGASLNLVDTNSGEMANLELWQGQHGLVRVGSNYSHTNAYKSREFLGWLDDPHPSSINRQARLDQLPVPQTASDVAARLGDTTDPHWPIYRDATLLTVVIDGGTGELRAWEDQNPATSEPTKKWNLGTFFGSDAAKLEHQGANHGLVSATEGAAAVASV